MNYLFFGGASDTGKTESIYKIAEYLITEKQYTVIRMEKYNNDRDIECVLENDKKKILIYSLTDLVSCIKYLKDLRDKETDLDIIITAIRDQADYMRNYFFQIMNIPESDFKFEIPLGKVRRGDNREISKKWYIDNIINLAQTILSIDPFDI